MRGPIPPGLDGPQLYDALVDGERVAVYSIETDLFAVLQRRGDQGLVREGRALAGTVIHMGGAIHDAFAEASEYAREFAHRYLNPADAIPVRLSRDEIVDGVPPPRPPYNAAPTRFRVAPILADHVEVLELPSRAVSVLHSELLYAGVQRFLRYDAGQFMAPSIVIHGFPLLGTPPPSPIVPPPPSPTERAAEEAWRRLLPPVEIPFAGATVRIPSPPVPPVPCMSCGGFMPWGRVWVPMARVADLARYDAIDLGVEFGVSLDQVAEGAQRVLESLGPLGTALGAIPPTIRRMLGDRLAQRAEEFTARMLGVPVESLRAAPIEAGASSANPRGALTNESIRELARQLQATLGRPPVAAMLRDLDAQYQVHHAPEAAVTDPRVRRLNERLEAHGVGVQVSPRCGCPLCRGALERLRVDGPMADAQGLDGIAERAFGDGHVPARTSVKQRQTNEAQRTVDAVLGDIDELLEEFNAGRSRDRDPSPAGD